jgi:glycerol-3-phosphate dehydrogenase
MGKQVVVIGLGRFGTSLATALHNVGYEVMAIDKDANLVENIAPNVTQPSVRTQLMRQSCISSGLAVSTLLSSVLELQFKIVY